MWMPREPDVFGQPTSPWSVSTSRATMATSTIWRQSTPGIGSRSTRSSSGCSRSSARTGCGLRSMQPRLTTQASAAASGHDDLFGRIARRVVQRRGLDPFGPLLGRALLEERLLRDALHEPLEHHRPAADAAQRAVGDGEVVVHEVELGDAGLGEHDLVGVRDAHLAAVDLQHLFRRPLAGSRLHTMPRHRTRSSHQEPHREARRQRAEAAHEEVAEPVLVADEDLAVDERMPEPLKNSQITPKRQPEGRGHHRRGQCRMRQHRGVGEHAEPHEHHEEQRRAEAHW